MRTARADLTVVPSVALEGFGLIVAESLAAGTPCLVTPVGGLPDAVGGLSRVADSARDGRGGDRRRAGRRADGRHAAADGARSAWTSRARHYDWPVIAERTRLVYEEAMR